MIHHHLRKKYECISVEFISSHCVFLTPATFSFVETILILCFHPVYVRTWMKSVLVQKDVIQDNNVYTEETIVTKDGEVVQ